MWEKVFEILTRDRDDSYLMIGSTIVRAHQQAASGKGGGKDQALGRSLGGLTTKVHLLCDALGRPVKVLITAGQAHDSTAALPLLKGQKTKAVSADKAYDTNELREHIAQINAQAVIPSKRNRKQPISHDTQLYKQCNRIERCFNTLKHWRRFATRYDRKTIQFNSFVLLAASTLWLH